MDAWLVTSCTPSPAEVCGHLAAYGVRAYVVGNHVVAVGDVRHMEAAADSDGPVRYAPHRVPVSYPLASKFVKEQDTTVALTPEAVFGDRARFVVVAGPCGVESRQQVLRTARAVVAAGAHVFRGGAFKPRTSPHSFQGLGVPGLEILADARKATTLPIVTEIMSPALVDVVAEHADCLQVGARNMQNFDLLRAVGRSSRPVLLKRGMSATLKEFLLSAEYVLAEGNPNVVLCERGIRTFETATRNTLDLAGVAWLKRETHLPVIVDPSHGTGVAALVPSLACAAAAVGADGIMVEVHPEPDRALSDGPQSLTLEGFQRLMSALKPFVEAAGRTL